MARKGNGRIAIVGRKRSCSVTKSAVSDDVDKDHVDGEEGG